MHAYFEASEEITLPVEGPVLAQGCRLARCTKVVSYLRYTGHQINVFVTATGHVGQRTDPTEASAREVPQGTSVDLTARRVTGYMLLRKL